MGLEEIRDAVSRAHAWRHGHGNTYAVTPLATFVVNPAHPNVWDANQVSRVSAASPAQIDELLAEMERRFSHAPDRVAITDDFTPPGFVARLAFEDYRERVSVLQMVLDDGATPAGRADLTLREVREAADWDALWRLAVRDFAEGARSSGVSFGSDVARGLFAGYRAKRDIAPFFLAEIGGEPVAYGSVVTCPGGVGFIDDLFTLPEFRGRGVASTIVTYGAGLLRARGSRIVCIGALPAERPKRLYAKLGFAPLMLARTWVREAAPAG